MGKNQPKKDIVGLENEGKMLQHSINTHRKLIDDLNEDFKGLRNSLFADYGKIESEIDDLQKNVAYIQDVIGVKVRSPSKPKCRVNGCDKEADPLSSVGYCQDHHFGRSPPMVTKHFPSYDSQGRKDIDATLIWLLEPIGQLLHVELPEKRAEIAVQLADQFRKAANRLMRGVIEGT